MPFTGGLRALYDKIHSGYDARVAIGASLNYLGQVAYPAIEKIDSDLRTMVRRDLDAARVKLELEFKTVPASAVALAPPRRERITLMIRRVDDAASVAVAAGVPMTPLYAYVAESFVEVITKGPAIVGEALGKTLAGAGNIVGNTAWQILKPLLPIVAVVGVGLYIAAKAQAKLGVPL